jgi:hypothetical protein
LLKLKYKPAAVPVLSEAFGRVEGIRLKTFAYFAPSRFDCFSLKKALN